MLISDDGRGNYVLLDKKNYDSSDWEFHYKYNPKPYYVSDSDGKSEEEIKINGDHVRSIYIGDYQEIGVYYWKKIFYEHEDPRDRYIPYFDEYRKRGSIIGNCPNLKEVTISLKAKVNWYKTIEDLYKKEVKLILKYSNLDEILAIFENEEYGSRHPASYGGLNHYITYYEDLWKWPKIPPFNPLTQKCEIILNGPELSEKDKNKIKNKFKLIGIFSIRFNHKELVPYYKQVQSNNELEQSLKNINKYVELLPQNLRQKLTKKINEIIEKFEKGKDNESSSILSLLKNDKSTSLTLTLSGNAKKEALADIIDIELNLLKMSEELNMIKELKNIIESISNLNTNSSANKVKIDKIIRLLVKINNPGFKELVTFSIIKQYELELEKIYSKIEKVINDEEIKIQKELSINNLLDTSIDNLDIAINYNNIINAINNNEVINYSRQDDIVSSINNTKYIINKIQNDEGKKMLIGVFNDKLKEDVIVEIEKAIKNGDFSFDTYESIKTKTRLIIQEVLITSRKIPVNIEVDFKDIFVDEEEYDRKLYKNVCYSFIKDINNYLENGGFYPEEKEMVKKLMDEKIEELSKDNVDLASLKELSGFFAELALKADISRRTNNHTK